MNTSEQDETGMDKTIAKLLPSKLPSESVNTLKKSYAKTDPRYWKQPGRLVKQKDMNAYGVRFSHGGQGRREFFSLDTPNKETAARKAADIFRKVSTLGWDVALAELKPKPEPAAATCIRDVIEVLESIDLHGRTRREYCKALRWWAGKAASIEFNPKKPDEWHRRTEKVHVRVLERNLIERIRDRFIQEAAKRGGDEENKARISVRSMLRNARAAISHTATKVPMPDPLPFQGVTVRGVQTVGYRGTFDAGKLLQSAQQGLAEHDPEAFSVILLALGAGLRRGEIENLRWEACDASSNRIWIVPTNDWKPKTGSSHAPVDVSPTLIALILLRRGNDAKGHVVGRGATDRACAWLRANGVDGEKPLHMLRKEFGSLVLLSSDLVAAQRQLRHSTINLTASVYVENRRHAAPDIGSMLASGK